MTVSMALVVLARTDLWLSRLVRVVGIAGLVFEIVVDRVRNPTALVVFGGLAEGPDLFSYWMAHKQDDPANPRGRGQK